MNTFASSRRDMSAVWMSARIAAGSFPRKRIAVPVQAVRGDAPAARRWPETARMLRGSAPPLRRASIAFRERQWPTNPRMTVHRSVDAE